MSSGTIAAPQGYTAALERAAILMALDAWIRQRPGLDFRNHCNSYRDEDGRRAYHAEVRAVGRSSTARSNSRASRRSRPTARTSA